MSEIIEAKFTSYEDCIRRIFEKIAERTKKEIKDKKIVIKPNLTTNLPPPVTTDVECVEAIIENFINLNVDNEIIVAEGSGGCDTLDAFKNLGYEKLVKEFGIKLLDLNREERVELKNPNALKLKDLFYPKVLLNSYLVSVPVPKEHSSAIITNSLKNMFGVYLSKSYLVKWNESLLRKIGVVVARRIFARGWSKADLHVLGVNECIYDLNLYKKPDLTICDGRIGQKDEEINGSSCEPPLNRIIASFDPVACDSYVARLFGYSWEKIKYLRYCHGKIGDAKNLEVIKV